MAVQMPLTGGFAAFAAGAFSTFGIGGPDLLPTSQVPSPRDTSPFQIASLWAPPSTEQQREALGAKCYLSAIVGGDEVLFDTAKEKFEALAEAWEMRNLGRSVFDYNHLSHLQIIGMGATAVPFLLLRLQDGESKWVYALKCIVGEKVDTPAMIGQRSAVIAAWLEWGLRHAQISE